MAEHEQISINDLKSDQVQPSIQEQQFVDPNVSIATEEAHSEKNIVSASDIGLPRKEKEVEKNDIDKAYDLLDAYIDKKQDEINRFNQAMDANGGEISELEWRAQNGEAPTSVMVDGVPQDIAESGDISRYEDMLGADNALTNESNASATQEIIKPEEDSELDQLEREAAAYDASIEKQNAITSNNESMVYHEPEAAVNPEPTPITADEKIKPTLVQSPSKPSKDKLDYVPTTMESGAIKVNAAPMKSSLDDIDKDINKLMGEAEETSSKPSDDNEYGDKIKLRLKEKMSSNIISIDNFKIATNEPITSANILNTRHTEVSPVFKWALYHTGMPFTMKKFYAYELDELRDNINSETNPRAIFQLIYDHIVDGKGTDFIKWTKSVNRLDINNLWMGVYGACFQFSNYLPYDCDRCKNVMITDGTRIRDMVKFKNTDIENRFNQIMEMDASNPDLGTTHGTAIVPISNTIAIGTKEPSIYDTIIEPTLLDNSFIEKYNDVIRYLPFIDNVYFIDTATRRLRPVAHAEIVNNEAKTLKLKILQWAKVFRTFNSDEQGILLNAITNMSDEKLNDIQYCVPAITCDKCGAEIPESIMGAADLVFIRHQLTLFGAV